jgi:putative DNA primase/helicase
MADDDAIVDMEAVRAEVERLAKLDLLAYENERKRAAENLGIRTSTLDKLVAKAGGSDRDLSGQAIVFTEDPLWPWPVDLLEVIDEVNDLLEQLMVMAPLQRLTFTLWCVFTHCLSCFDCSPRLAFRSLTMRSGKTRLMTVLRHLVAKPLLAVNASASALFRLIDEHCPTLLLDEGDTFLLGDDQTLKGLLNAGFTRNDAFILRTEGEEKKEVRRFSVWGAVAVARIGQNTATLEDRSISILLQRKMPSDPVARFNKGYVTRLGEIRRRMARWAKDHAEELLVHAPQLPAGLNDRQCDCWWPLLCIAELAGGTIAEQARLAATTLSGENELGVQPLEIQALAAAYTWLHLEENQERQGISNETLVAYLTDLEDPEGRWQEYGRRRESITKYQLSRLLKRIGVISGSFWEGNPRKSYRGYARDDLMKAANRYLSPSQLANSSNAL